MSLSGPSPSVYSSIGTAREESGKEALVEEARLEPKEELEAGAVSAAPPILVEGPLLQSHL